MDMDTPHTDAWPTGFMLIQGNRLEALGDLMTTWMRSHPLRPLEDEVILVQSNGIGQWLKLALARDAGDEQGGCGIAAALQVTLPARFIWNTYCQVLGDLPDISAFHKAPLGWRLYRMLGNLDALAKAPGTADHLQPLQGFLQTDGDVRRRHQLAMRLADLFDQYQVYRSDWLQAWQAGEDVLIRPDGRRDTVPETQRWQPLLWRALLEDITRHRAKGTEVICIVRSPGAKSEIFVLNQASPEFLDRLAAAARLQRTDTQPTSLEDRDEQPAPPRRFTVR